RLGGHRAASPVRPSIADGETSTGACVNGIVPDVVSQREATPRRPSWSRGAEHSPRAGEARRPVSRPTRLRLPILAAGLPRAAVWACVAPFLGRTQAVTPEREGRKAVLPSLTELPVFCNDPARLTCVFGLILVCGNSLRRHRLQRLPAAPM